MNIEQYKTSDILLAACLRVQGYQLSNIELVGSKGTFVFCNVDQSYINEFNLGNCLIEPVTFNNTVKQLTTSVRRMAQKDK